jgi:phosphoglycolate phosphatase
VALSAVLIDLDGTLVDTLPDIHAALGVMCGRLALDAPPIDTVRGWIGKGSLKLVELVLNDQSIASSVLPDQALAAYLNAYDEINGRYAKVYPGVVEGLERFRHHGIQAACVTNKPHHLAANLLDTCKLRTHLAAVMGGDEHVALKPAPDLLGAMVKVLGARLDKTLMLGDSENDLAAARAAGCCCVLVDYGYSPLVPVQGLGADAIVSTLGEACDWMLARSH